MENQLKNMEFSLRGRWCEQMIENEMLPNLSAADVARCAELSFSCILACSETVDLWQAEGCGREDWQEMGGGLYLEILSVLWLSDRTVRCVRWLYIQVIFKDSFTEPAARSCQAEEKCQSGFFFCLFFGSQWKFVCAAFGMKKSNFVCPWKYSQIHLRLPQLLRVQIGL